MKFLEEAGYRYDSRSQKRKKFGLFLCDCGNQSVHIISQVKQGYVRGCMSCKRLRQGRTSRKDPKIVIGNHLYSRIKSNAKHRGIPFELTKAYTISLCFSPCHYCGLFYVKGGNLLTGSKNITEERKIELDIPHCGIDRVNSDLPYIASNCVPCCKICNLAKHVLSSEQYIAHCTQVARHNVKGSN